LSKFDSTKIISPSPIWSTHTTRTRHGSK